MGFVSGARRVAAEHIHRLDFCFIVVQGGDLEHADPDDPAGSTQAVRYTDDQVVFIEAGQSADGVVHNRLTNVGATPYKNYVIELKDVPSQDV